VENCIKHGLSRKVGGGTVTLRVERLADAAAVEVVDDGLGMSAGMKGCFGMSPPTIWSPS